MIFIESGRKRKGEYYDCEQCEETFIRRLSGSNGVKRYCSRKCSSLGSRTRVEVSCESCGKKIFRPPSRLESTKSGLSFCSKICLAAAQKLEGGDPRIHPPHYGNGDRMYKQIALRHHPNWCVDCGATFMPILVAHHKDGNRENNDPSNLEIVCQNHHIARHMRWTEEGVWIYSTSSLTPRDRLPEVLRLIEGKQIPGAIV